MTGVTRFDDSLAALVAVVASELGDDAVEDGTVLRDAFGRLAFFTSRKLPEAVAERLATDLVAALGGYARADRPVADSDDFSTASVLEDPLALRVMVGPRRVRLVDRRLVGGDWLRAPAPPAPPPPRFVFASLKGGVGRSTALAVVAAHLASRGKRVLAVDLDLEAPGLAWTLLAEDTFPPFGILDALVENNISGLDAAFMADMVGPSALAHRGGRIDVIPAFGRRSIEHPADVLAKLARAYAEDIRPDGSVATILDQVRTIVDGYSDPTRYDAILIDARAGLHETSASAILGLGAEVFLFGLDEPQTFRGYAVLLAHLARFLSGGERPEWTERLTMVQGKAPVDAEQRQAFVEQCRLLFEEAGFSPPAAPKADAAPVPLPAGPSFKDVPWSDEISDEELLAADWSIREPVAVLDDARFQRFDPMRRRDLLSESIYLAAFQQLVERVESSFGVDEEAT
jgi:MinD-like ATPase involved in chromosome partitioning or flagellar assembly